MPPSYRGDDSSILSVSLCKKRMYTASMTIERSPLEVVRDFEWIIPAETVADLWENVIEIFIAQAEFRKQQMKELLTEEKNLEKCEELPV